MTEQQKTWDQAIEHLGRTRGHNSRRTTKRLSGADASRPGLYANADRFLYISLSPPVDQTQGLQSHVLFESTEPRSVLWKFLRCRGLSASAAS